MESIERHLIIPSDLKGDDREEYIEIQGNLFTKVFRDKEFEHIKQETGMKKYKSVDEMERDCFHVTREEIIGAYRVAGLRVPEVKKFVVPQDPEKK